VIAPPDRARTFQPVPGVYRLGDSTVNFYVIDHGGKLVLVDTGLPAHYGQLASLLSRLGRKPSDISAALVTHAHPDHLGLAARLQAGGAEIWVHQADQAALADPRHITRYAKSERSLLPYLLRRPAALALPLHLPRSGAFTEAPVVGPRVFTAPVLTGVAAAASEALLAPVT
jgi:glyoxylase-like metal-dependent hydrolase (beta-lactamase superfamily II)